MTWSLSSVLTLHMSKQLKLNSDGNWTIKLSQRQIRESAKQNSIRWCQQCNKPGAISRKERDSLKGYKLRTNYIKNTTNVSSCDLEQVTQTKYPNQKYVREIMPTLHVSSWMKHQNEVKQNSSFRYHDSENKQKWCT